MSNQAVSAMTALSAAGAAANDLLYVVDTDAGTAGSKKMVLSEVLQAALNTTTTGFSPTVVTPTALAANTDNWASATGVTNRISASAAYNLTGIVAEGNGSVKLLWNVGTFPITLINELTSTAANRFTCAGGANIVLGPGELAMLVYSTTTSRWLTTKVRSDIGQGTLIVRQPGGTAGTHEIQVAHAGSTGTVSTISGTLRLVSAGADIDFVSTGSTRDFAGATAIHRSSTTLTSIPTGAQFGWGSPLDVPDTGIKRDAAVVVAATNGSSGSGWFQNTAGSKRVATTVTNATTTFSNLTDLTTTVIAGRKYVGKLGLFVSNTTAANGIKLDFEGGTATWTSFTAAISSNIQAATLGVTVSTAIATDLTLTAMNGTTTHYVEVTFSGVVNAAGTLIPRFAENSTGGGLASVLVNSFSLTEDVP